MTPFSSNSIVTTVVSEKSKLFQAKIAIFVHESSRKNINLVEDVEKLIPVEFRSAVAKSQVCESQALAAIFID